MKFETVHSAKSFHPSNPNKNDLVFQCIIPVFGMYNIHMLIPHANSN